MYILIGLLIALIVLIVLYKYKTNHWYMCKENFAPYASILVPEIINSSAGFDVPNQYGEVLDPYVDEKLKSEDKLFYQIRAVNF